MTDDAIRARWNGEAWLPIPGYPGYEASSLGRVRRVAPYVRAGAIIGVPKKAAIAPRRVHNRTAHLAVTLSFEGQRRDALVHRLVALTFIGPQPDGKPLVCHRDDDPTNNCPENLFWGSAADNSADMVRKGRQARGSLAANSKLDEFEISILRAKAKVSGLSQRALAKQFGISQAAVSMALSGKTWRHV